MKEIKEKDQMRYVECAHIRITIQGLDDDWRRVTDLSDEFTLSVLADDSEGVLLSAANDIAEKVRFEVLRELKHLTGRMNLSKRADKSEHSFA